MLTESSRTARVSSRRPHEVVATLAGVSSPHLDCWPFGEVALYEPCRVVGTLHRLRLDPIDGSIRAVLIDGADSLSAVWAISPSSMRLSAAVGRQVLLLGVAVLGEDGVPTMLEPYFDVLPS